MPSPPGRNGPVLPVTSITPGDKGRYGLLRSPGRVSAGELAHDQRDAWLQPTSRPTRCSPSRPGVDSHRGGDVALTAAGAGENTSEVWMMSAPRAGRQRCGRAHADGHQGGQDAVGLRRRQVSRRWPPSLRGRLAGRPPDPRPAAAGRAGVSGVTRPVPAHTAPAGQRGFRRACRGGHPPPRHRDRRPAPLLLAARPRDAAGLRRARPPRAVRLPRPGVLAWRAEKPGCPPGPAGEPRWGERWRAGTRDSGVYDSVELIYTAVVAAGGPHRSERRYSPCTQIPQPGPPAREGPGGPGRQPGSGH